MNNALYFPYISIPDTPWLIQTLLYWDKIASIVPREIADDHKKLQPHMKQLLDNGLVTLLNPSEYIWQINGFEEKFTAFLNSIPKRIRSNIDFDITSQREFQYEKIHSDKLKNVSFNYRQNYTQIHMEKLFPVTEALIESGLAYRGEDNWYYVEKQIAGYFMTYLAVEISNITSYQPISDRYSGLCAFGGGAFGGRPPSRSRLRARVLEDILPAPIRVENFHDIYNFKDKYNDELKRFRRRIERFLISIDHLAYNEAMVKVEDFIEEISEEKDELAKRMGESGFPNIKFDTICALGSFGASIADGIVNSNPFSFASGTFGLAQFWSKLRDEHHQNRLHPMAYAVYVHKRLNRFSSYKENKTRFPI